MTAPDGTPEFGAGFAAVSEIGPSDRQLREATRQAVDSAIRDLSRAPDLIAVFASASLDLAVAAGEPDADLDAVGAIAQEVSGAGHAIGCSAAGVCGDGQAVLGSAGVSAWAGVLPGARMRAFHLEVMRSGDGLAVIGLPELEDEQWSDAGAAALLFADPYSFPVVSFVDRASEVLPGITLVGGIGGGAAGAGSTRLFLDGRTVDRGAVGLLIAGADQHVVVSQGCRPVGPEMIVTAADGNVILELAGRPALQRLYEVVAGLSDQERVSFAGGPQIGIAMNEYADEHDLGDYLIRAVIGIDEQRQAVAVGDVVEVGRTVRFQLRDAAAARADLQSRLMPAAPSKGALLISCNGRGPAMFGAAESDVSLVSDCLGGAAVAGLFAGGEIGPVGGRPWLHGFTASVLAFT